MNFNLIVHSDIYAFVECMSRMNTYFDFSVSVLWSKKNYLKLDDLSKKKYFCDCVLEGQGEAGIFLFAMSSQCSSVSMVTRLQA
jgi:hypothetical protein